MNKFYRFVDPDCFDIDLTVGKIYKTVEPRPSDPPTDIRVIDDTGVANLYPLEWFENEQN